MVCRVILYLIRGQSRNKYKGVKTYPTPYNPTLAQFGTCPNSSRARARSSQDLVQTMVMVAVGECHYRSWNSVSQSSFLKKKMNFAKGGWVGTAM
jgi:hypothetical protein